MELAAPDAPVAQVKTARLVVACGSALLRVAAAEAREAEVVARRAAGEAVARRAGLEAVAQPAAQAAVGVAVPTLRAAVEVVELAARGPQGAGPPSAEAPSCPFGLRSAPARRPAENSGRAPPRLRIALP